MGASPIYLDYAATSPLDARVAETMRRFLDQETGFGNPASTHAHGRAAAAAVEDARDQLARLIHAQPGEIVWTSGATEANNLALQGAVRFHRNRPAHIVTARTEHKSVVDCCRQLERDGCRVTWLKPGADGLLDPAQVEAALTPETLLVSVMHVNNEIGVIQDIAAIGRITRARGIMLMVDATQSLGKLPIDLRELDVDLMSFSAHKLCGPKGIGALYVRREPRARLQPVMHGGGHERGLRSGTLPTHQIAGFGEACRIAAEEMPDEQVRVAMLRERLWHGLQPLSGITLNGHPSRRVAGILNLSFEGVDGEALLADLVELSVASGAACTSASAEPSYVLRALGHSDELAQSSLRFSLGRWTTAEEISLAVGAVSRSLERLRKLSPLWPVKRSQPAPALRQARA
jgi:cysteine desulfurase